MTEKLENQSDTRPEDVSPGQTRPEQPTPEPPSHEPPSPERPGHMAVPAPAHAPTSGPPGRAVSKVAELSTSKVLAGGMAAATSAVLGSHFGAFGTVGGAAVGSVVTTIGTNLYQRSLERARDRVARQIPLPANLVARTSLGATRADIAPDPAPGATSVLAVAPAPSPRQPSDEQLAPPVSAPFPLGRLVGMSLLGVLLFFALGLGVVTGIEWVKGSPLSGGTQGTSVGQAFAPVIRKPATPAPVERERQTSDAPSVEPSATPDPGSDSGSKKSDKDKSDKSQKSDEEKPKSTSPTTPSLSVTPSTPLPIPGLGDLTGG